MSAKQIFGQMVELDEDGHFCDYKIWCDDMACEIAQNEGIAELKDGHWKVIRYMRDEFEKNQVCPTIRKMTKLSGVDTKELYALFPKAPAKMAAKIAGLPKPKGCI